MRREGDEDFVVNAARDLSSRAICILMREGYYTKHDVYKGVKAGAIRPNLPNEAGLQHYGPKTHAEVCAWAGVDIGKGVYADLQKAEKAESTFLSIREFEKALRDRLGLSCRQAKRAAAGGWFALANCNKKDASERHGILRCARRVRNEQP